MKHSFLLVLLVFTALFGFSQKGKTKTKNKEKAQSSTTIPNPGNPSAKPEVKQKQLPQVYDNNVPGSTTGQVGSSAPTKDTTKTPTGASTSADGGDKPTLGNPPATGAGTGSSTSADTRPMTTDPNTTADGVGKPVKDMKGDKGEKGDKGGKENKEWKKEHKDKHAGQKDHDDDEDGNGNNKERNHIPAQVEKSFAAEYPGASNAVWTKQNGRWTVNFSNNGSPATATYQSNGQSSSENKPGKKEINRKKNKG